MAWSTPSARSTGDLITAATWNQDVVDNVTFLHARKGSMFVPPTAEWDGSTVFASPVALYNSRVATSKRPSSTGQYVFFSWRVPNNYSSVSQLLVVYVPTSGGTPTLNCVSSYGAAGQAHNAHSGNISAAIGQTAGNYNTWAIASAYPNLAAGDYASARIAPTADWPGGDFGAFGLWFEYNPT